MGVEVVLFSVFGGLGEVAAHVIFVYWLEFPETVHHEVVDLACWGFEEYAAVAVVFFAVLWWGLFLAVYASREIGAAMADHLVVSCQAALIAFSSVFRCDVWEIHRNLGKHYSLTDGLKLRRWYHGFVFHEMFSSQDADEVCNLKHEIFWHSSLNNCRIVVIQSCMCCSQYLPKNLRRFLR